MFTDYFAQINRSDSAKLTYYNIDFLLEKNQPDEREDYDFIFSDKGDKRHLACTPIILKNWIFGFVSMNRKTEYFAINVETKKVCKGSEYLNVYPYVVGFDDEYLLIPYEFSNDNKNEEHLPDSVKIASQNGENVIIKVNLND